MHKDIKLNYSPTPEGIKIGSIWLKWERVYFSLLNNAIKQGLLNNDLRLRSIAPQLLAIYNKQNNTKYKTDQFEFVLNESREGKQGYRYEDTPVHMFHFSFFIKNQ